MFKAIYIRDYIIDEDTVLFDEEFNGSIDHIIFPKKIKYIYFGHQFDCPMDKVKLPKALTHLEFGYSFNQSLENVELPDSIEHISFGYKFNQNLDKVKLPNSLKSLSLRMNANVQINNLPSGLEVLKLEACKMPLINLPLSLKKISFRRTPKEIIDACKLPHDCKINIEA